MNRIAQLTAERPDEKRILIVRKHWLVLVRRIVFIVILAALPVILFLAAPAARGAITDRSVAGVVLLLGLSAYAIYLILSFLNGWVVYALDMWILTTKRIADIQQQGLFSREISELPLEKVEDVTAQTDGILPTLFHFGTIIVKTASEDTGFRFTNVAQPNVIAEKILELQRAYIPDKKQAAIEAQQKETNDDVPTFPGVKPTRK